MAWKGREDVQPEFSQLVSSLNNSRLQQSNNALYQTILQLIQFTQQKRNLDVTNVVEINRSINTAAGNIIIIQGDVNNLKNVVVLTGDDETAILPNSRQLLPGDAIGFDDSVANARTVNVLVDGVTVTINGSNQLVASGTGAIVAATVTLANADILALPTTDFELVPAQGAGTIIVPILTFSYVNVAAGIYTNIDPAGWGGLQINTHDVSNYIGDTTFSGFTYTLTTLLGFATIRAFSFVPLQEPGVLSPGWWSGINIIGLGTNVINQPLMLHIDNAAAGNFTGGNAANTWKVTTYYGVFNV